MNEELLRKIVASRELMLSSTRLGEEFVLRFCVLNHRTQREDIDEALRIIEKLGHEAEQSVA